MVLADAVGEPGGPQWEALLRLTAAIRRATELVIDTDACPDDLAATAELVERAVARLEAAPAGRRHVTFAPPREEGGRAARIDTAPLIGLANPVAPPLRVVEVGASIRAVGTFGAAYEGPPGHMHGGFVAAALDEMVGMAQSLSGQGGMTGTIVVRYRAPTPLYTELQFEAHIDRVEGRKIYTVGTIHNGDVLCAEAEAVFISIDWDRMREATGRA